VKQYLQEVYRVLKRTGTFICISHDNKRHNQYLKTAGVEWESIEILKVYKPTLAKETKLIKSEFIHRSVIDKIEDLSRVEATREDEESNWVIVPYENMPPFVPRVKQPPVLNPHGDDPAEVPCYYVYICKKPYIKTPEPSLHGEEEKSEQEEQDFINQNSRY